VTVTEPVISVVKTEVIQAGTKAPFKKGASIQAKKETIMTFNKDTIIITETGEEQLIKKGTTKRNRFVCLVISLGHNSPLYFSSFLNIYHSYFINAHI